MQQVGIKAVSQDDIVSFLSDPKSYGSGDSPVTRIDTHISLVFLVGDRAYKMKRAVRFPYLDYSTIQLRRRFCEAEVALNRRTAPMLYRGAVPVTREADGALQLDGDGEPVEWLVEMARFEQSALFDRMAVAGQLTPSLLTELADAIAAFHAAAAPVPDRSGSAAMRWIVDGNETELATHAPEIFDPDQVAALVVDTRKALADVSGVLDIRARQDRLRRCHGDLHLRNICLVEGRPVLFDGIEFDDAISIIDPLYDLAFLLMDLEHRGHGADANLVLNRYLAMADERDGIATLPLFLSCRAAVRAKTTAAAAATADPTAADELIAEARRYLDLAGECLRPCAPVLVAVGGLSGSGKSTLAQRLAPDLGRLPGAVLLRSDVVRKRLAGVPPETVLDQNAYTPQQSEIVYRTVLMNAAAILETGQSVIVDAVFARAEERAAIENIAETAGVSAHFLWLDAPADTLQSRVAARTGDASDADAAVVRQQLTYETGSIDWVRIDAGKGATQTLATTKSILGL